MFSQKAAPRDATLPPLLCIVTSEQTLQSDSRKVKAGDVFVACRGEYTDGRNYIEAAIERGASFIFWDDDGKFIWQDKWKIANQGIKDLTQRAGILAAVAYDQIARDLNIIGVTGTNGKTSVTQWLAQAIDILEQQKSCAIIGTVGNGFFGQLQEATHTTPEPVTVQTLLRDFARLGAKSIAMEVSSHGLDQYRVNGVPFRTAVFTNLTRDHLDYHHGMAHYGATKARLFFWQDLQYAIINIDDEFGRQLAEQVRQECPHVTVYTYGFSSDANVKVVHFQANAQGMFVHLDTPWGKGEAQTQLLGRFNAQNFAATLAVLCVSGYSLSDALSALSKIRPAIGRMDCIIQANQPLVVVDYAHTPDALEKALLTLREIQTADSQLWCVFGCGGNRDRGKRPIMGAVVAQGADKVVITSDNPRMEQPQAIIADILPAVPHPVLVESDRKKAIEQAIEQAKANDIILIAGKGHETYQDIAGRKTHFSDFEVAQEALRKRVVTQ